MHRIIDLAQKINAIIIGDDQLVVTRLAPIARATTGELTYLSSHAYQRYLENTHASAVILSADQAPHCPVTALVVQNPELAFAKVAALFQTSLRPVAGIHPTAVIANTAQIDVTASIGPYCVIGEHVSIGANTVLSASVTVENQVTIGADCYLYSHVTLYHHIALGNRVIIHSGAVIGADGFGFAHEQGHFERIPQLGSVVIADDVEIGANSCVDRGALDNTVIETGVKLDNFVQIAHNVVVGAHTIMAGCTSVAGSTTIGRHCMIGGAATIGNHLSICDQVILTGCAMVTKSVTKPGIYSSGTGLFPNAVWRKVVARLRRLTRSSR